MSSTFTLYVVDENALPAALPGTSDQQRYDAIVAAVKSRGARWGEVRTTLLEFSRALERVDDEMGGTKFLPVLAFNNSPHNLLGDSGTAPLFGYFNPLQASDLSESLRDVAANVDAYVEKSKDETTESVFHVFQSTAKEAKKRGFAVAVLHDA